MCTLRNFSRIKTESSAAFFVRFKSLHIFYLQIDHPADADQIRLISYYTLLTVTQYFISNKCAAAWGTYVLDQVRLGEVITKENIIKTFTCLEQYSMIDTTLNLPPGDETVTIPAHQAEIQIATTSEAIIGSSSEPSTITAFLG